MHGGVVNHHTPFGHDLFELTQAQRVDHVPAYTQQHHIQWVVQPLQNLAQDRRFELEMNWFHTLQLNRARLLRQRPFGRLLNTTSVLAIFAGRRTVEQTALKHARVACAHSGIL
jgi:NAD(P)-dependent dehydrogenase (short-subunit alcohol dehydrogenase family)